MTHLTHWEGCGEEGITLRRRDNCEGQGSFRRQIAWVERETLKEIQCKCNKNISR